MSHCTLLRRLPENGCNEELAKYAILHAKTKWNMQEIFIPAVGKTSQEIMHMFALSLACEHPQQVQTLQVCVECTCGPELQYEKSIDADRESLRLVLLVVSHITLAQFVMRSAHAFSTHASEVSA